MINYPLVEILLPMGGTTVKELEKMEDVWESDDYIAEEKYDGSRYLSVGGRFFSRKISVKTNYPVEKTENVPHLQAIFTQYPLLILDGEIYIEGANSNKVTSIMGAGIEKALARQAEQGNVNYMVYDILRTVDGDWLMELPWMERRAILEKQMAAIFIEQPAAIKYVGLSKYVIENKKEFNAAIMRRGGEGVMLKNIHAAYYPDKKPRWNWIKVKQEITSDVIITGFKPAVREYDPEPAKRHHLDDWQYYEDEDGVKVQLHNLAVANEMTQVTGKKLQPVSKWYFHNWIGAIEFSQYNDAGDLIPVGFCSGMKEELRKDISENPANYHGECMEISAMERTKDGFFRHPQFLQMREDKNQKDCIIGQD
jgi:ATP-dependent DNA ligase